MRRTLALIALVSILFVVAGCGMSRSSAASWANEYCSTHGGVNTHSQNGFFYTHDSEGEANVTCADGTVGAKS